MRTDARSPCARAVLLILAALLFLLTARAADAEEPRLEFPNGLEAAASAASLDLSALSHEDVDAVLPLLGQMDNLRHIDLGADRAVTAFEREGTPLPSPALIWSEDYYAHLELPAPGTEDERLSWADIRKIVEAVPEAEVEYRFHISDLRFSTLSEKLDINHIRFDDEGALIREILPCMQKLQLLDMDYCGVSSEVMAEIRSAYPDVKVVWRVWFGPSYDRLSVRTDVECVLASSIYGLSDENSGDLRYCTRVKYLDVGHSNIEHIDFVRDMRELEVLVVSLSDYCDLSPVAGLEKLEYFEGCNSTYTGVIDLTPLSTCPNLRHINVCFLNAVEGYESLAALKGLERLWFGSATPVPQSAVEALRSALPNAVINNTEPTGCLGTWRYDENGANLPRYALLREQFGYSTYDTAVARVYNDPKYFSPNRD